MRLCIAMVFCYPSYLIGGTPFTSRFLRSFQEGLGIKVKLSTAFHPQTNGQTERTIQTLEDMLRACITHLREIELSTCLWLSLLTKIAIIHIQLWLPMRPCMVGDEDLQLNGLK